MVLVDRSPMEDPAGSTGHAPGALVQILTSPDMTKLAQISAALYASLPADNPAYSAVGSIEVARDEATMRRFRDKVRRGKEAGIDAQILDAQGIKRLMPLMNVDGLLGGVFVPGDGVVDARRALSGLAAEVTRAGVDIRDRTTVIDVEMKAGKVSAVLTDRGRIECERVVVAVGVWGAELMKKLGVDLPLVPVQHPYIYTEPLPEWQGETKEAAHPLVRDLDNVIYYRQHGERIGYGWYSHAPLAADMGNLQRAELPYDVAVFDESLDLSLFPFLEKTPVASRLNGIFSMTPDAFPLLGPLDGFDGLWLAEAVWVTHAGGIGKVAAELLLDGHSTTIDARQLDANRFATLSRSQARDRSLELYNDIYRWPVV
jgi:glycine/D-amino acid oxidase-like deaminating enzyme